MTAPAKPAVAERLKALAGAEVIRTRESELLAIAAEVERVAREARHWKAIADGGDPLRDPWANAIEQLGELAAALAPESDK